MRTKPDEAQLSLTNRAMLDQVLSILSTDSAACVCDPCSACLSVQLQYPHINQKFISAEKLCTSVPGFMEPRARVSLR